MASLAGQILAGAYDILVGASGNEVTLGQTTTNGITLQHAFEAEPVMSDQYGTSTVSTTIYTGGRVTLSAQFNERSRDSLRAFYWQWTNGALADQGVLPIPGSDASEYEVRMVLRPFWDGSLAGQQNGTIYTFPHVILMPNNISEALKTGLRIIPLVWYALPYLSDGEVRFYTTTNPT